MNIHVINVIIAINAINVINVISATNAINVITALNMFIVLFFFCGSPKNFLLIQGGLHFLRLRDLVTH